MRYLEEFNRMVGVGPSLMEKASADPNLGVLSKAFSMRVKPEDVKYIRYREVEGGVELKDMAGRLGNILTSVEPGEVAPKKLVTFLKKGGAKSFKVEAQDKDVSLGDVKVVPDAESNTDLDSEDYELPMSSGVPSPLYDAVKADLLDRVRRPRWEYPSWAFSKSKLDEVDEDN